MLFSAAYSEQLELEQTRQERQRHARPQVLWRRGFHSEGGQSGWGYYLEPPPPGSRTHSTVSEDSEGTESTAVEDVDRAHEQAGRRRRRHDRGQKDGRWESRTADAHSRGTGHHAPGDSLILSHGSSLSFHVDARAPTLAPQDDE